MPRIEIKPPGWEATVAKGNGTPTEDLCAVCASNYAEGDKDVVLQGYPSLVEIGSVEVCHPSYDEDPMSCGLCGALLNDEDDD